MGLVLVEMHVGKKVGTKVGSDVGILVGSEDGIFVCLGCEAQFPGLQHN